MDMMHYEIKGDCLVVYIRDDLDHHAVTYLRETSDRLIEAGNVKNIIFDLGNVVIQNPNIDIVNKFFIDKKDAQI